MREIPDDTPSPNRLRAPEDRLESWKEIAAYLKRGVRTVQRWERDEGLPIYRHEHQKRATPYAFTSELDTWRNNHHENHAGEVASGAELGRSAQRRWVAAAGVAILVGLSITAWRSLSNGPDDGGFEFRARSWVLITDFDNRTGESLFDGSVEAALARELSNSSYAYVVPRSRVEAVLKLMQQSVDTPVDVGLAREIALRDGDVHAIVAGHVERLGAEYVVNVDILDAADGRLVGSHMVEAPDEEELLIALRTLSGQVRATLGERLATTEANGQRLERATTPSLRALQLYTQAVTLGNRGQWAAAEQLTREALQEDPDFAAAEHWLGWTLRRQGRSLDIFFPHFERAAQLADTTSSRERYFLLATYYRQSGDLEKAVAAYEALVQLHPDHRWGSNNLNNLYSMLGRLQEAARVEMTHADLRPNSLARNYLAAETALYAGDRDAIQRYIDRIRAMTQPDTWTGTDSSQSEITGRAWLALLPAHDHWAAGNVEDAITQVGDVADTFEPWSDGEDDHLACTVGLFYLTFGQLDTAEEWFGRSKRAWSWCGVGWVEFLRHDAAGLIGRLDEYIAARGKSRVDAIRVEASWLLPRVDALEAVPRFVADFASDAFDNNLLRVRLAQGYIALAEERASDAVSLLEQGLDYSTPARAFMGLEALVDAQEQLGNRDEAIHLLENFPISPQQAYCHCGSAGMYWMRTRWQLAKLYRQVGRTDDAQAIESELLDLLAFADADHPMLLDLQRLQSQAMTTQ